MIRICIATSTRADWGLLSPLAHALSDSPGVQVDILATNMHLLDRYGHTADEIIADGFDIAAPVPIDDPDGSARSCVHAMAQCADGTARALQSLQPDLIIILGDRYEMLAVASAAAVMRIPIVHIAGGEVSEGAIDNRLRNAITTLASLHLTATDQYRDRVVAITGDPANVHNTGALGVWNIMHRPLLSLDELCRSLDFEFEPGRLLLVTYHPATLDSVPPADRCRALLDALDRFPDYRVIITYPNNDEGSTSIIDAIRSWAKSPRVLAVKSLGMLRYLSTLQFAAAVVGNSSSGIVEVPSMGIPTVDVGIRQRGRIAAPSVIHSADDTDAIAEAIALALSPQMQTLAALRQNPYYKPDTVALMRRLILDFVRKQLATDAVI